MYVWQMNDGRWQVTNFTSTQYDVRMVEVSKGYNTREEAETALKEWRERYPDAIKARWRY